MHTNTVKQTDDSYLHPIYMLQLHTQTATAPDLIKMLEVNTSTAYTILGRLEKSGHIKLKKGSRNRQASIVLTEKGIEIAEKLFKKHQMIHKWLIQLGVEEEERAKRLVFWSMVLTKR